MQIKPYSKNILVEPVVKEQILVAEKKSLCEYGKVVAIGSEVKDIKVGDIVGYLVLGVSSLEIENKTYYFIPETTDFLLATIENDKIQLGQ